MVFSFVVTPIVLGTNQYVHPVVTPVVFSVLLIDAIVTHSLLALQRVFPSVRLARDYYSLQQTFVDTFPRCPKLFVSSQGDKLVTPTHVKEFITALKQRGHDVTTFKETLYGEDVNHTSSFFKCYPRYSAELDRFLGLKKEETDTGDKK